MAPKRSKSSPEVRSRLKAQTQAKNDAVRRRTATRQAVSKAGRGLPPAGQSSGGSQQARDQRRNTARRVQAGQQTTVARAWNRVQRANDRADSIRSQSRMTSGSTRYVPPGGENAKGPASLPPGQRGGEMRQRGGALSRSQGGSPGGVQGPRGGSLARSGSSASTNGRVERVQVREIRGSGASLSGGSGRPSLAPGQQRVLPPGRPGGALARTSGGAGAQVARAAGTVSRAASKVPKVGLLGAGLTALAIPGAVADVARQTRRTGEAFQRMVATAPGSSKTGPKGSGNGSRSRVGGPMADIRGTGRQVKPAQNAQEGPSRTPSRPTTPSAPQRPPVASSGGRSGGSSAPATSSGASTPASKASPAPASGEYKTDSWSINFLRQRRAAERALASRQAPPPPAPPGSGNLPSSKALVAKASEKAPAAGTPSGKSLSDLLKKRRS
jgi:hypothetical protein